MCHQWHEYLRLAARIRTVYLRSFQVGDWAPYTLYISIDDGPLCWGNSRGGIKDGGVLT